VIDFESLSPDAPAIILLCTSLGVDRGATGSRPLGPVAWSRLDEALRRQSFRGPRDLVGLTADEMARSLGVGEDVAAGYVRLLGRSGQLAFELDRLRSRGIWVVTIVDDAYPGVLRDRLGSWAPPVLFGSGPAGLLVGGGIAIVGSREADDDAIGFTSRLAAAAAAGGTSVVSGGARGIDAAAMRAAVEAGGSVVGVVPEGVERRLREPSTRSAVAGGQAVLVSPYHPSAAFSAGAAMGRNKLIYALSDVAVVVSSADGSGGTWTGALEDLKGGWVPLLVRDDASAPAGNRSLVRLGAAPLSSAAIGAAIGPSELLAHAARSGAKLAEPAAPTQQELFDDPTR
jgi:predicted Rossmann fold nucleotide-binding protein DprA/Smf involved in DNA uptake